MFRFTPVLAHDITMVLNRKNMQTVFERDATGLNGFNDLCLAILKVLLPDPEIC